MNLKIIFKILPVFLFLSTVCLSQEPHDKNNAYDYTNFDTQLIAPGEKLVYTAYIFGKMLPLGKAVFEINEKDQDGRKFYQFTGTVKGGYLIFTVKINMQSLVDYNTLRPYISTYVQKGFEKRVRKLNFDWQNKELIYSKKKFWKDEYKQRGKTPILPHTRDILSTMYFARKLKPVLHEKMIMNLVEKLHIWTVVVETVDKKVIRLRDGTKCKAILVTIKPHEISKNKLFKGLFGLKGNISLWVTEHKSIPLQIKGDYTMGFFNLHITVILDKWSPSNLIETQ
ncbi:DUF3108 domain-containing protein [bacterium]|nr:DUF3108 domain-containing protein [bacterium]